MTQDHRIGSLLVEAGAIHHDELNRALQAQHRSNDKLGQILLSLTRINPQRLFSALAKQQSLTLVDLERTPPDQTLLSYDDLDDYVTWRCIPWKREHDILTLACCELSAPLKQWASQHFAVPITWVMTTPRDIRHAIQHAFHERISDDTRNRLYRKQPELSAFTTITTMQRYILMATLLLMCFFLYLKPYPTLVTTLILINGFYIITIGLRIILFFSAFRTRSTFTNTLEEAALPLYTILIPLYKEQDGIAHILSAIRNLDYPASKLDVKLVVEADDIMTIEAIKRARPEPYFEMIRVPYSLPRTKPKACNYALSFARGEFVTIYDAEDVPEPMQLKKAVAAFRSAADDVICLQARLNYYNWNESTLSKLFAIEYASLFDVILPSLQSSCIPIPLGGTSNHIRLKKLREIGDWDPYNVTEDADLGMRLALLGYRTQILDSVTLEEAPISLHPWLKQRSRWIKGYMQTWLVYMRHPITLYRRMTRRGFWGFQFFIGGPSIVFFASPLLWVMTVAWWLDYIPIQALPQWMLQLCTCVLLMGIACHLLYAIRVVRLWHWPHMVFIILLYPFYWLLHSIASFKALWQLIFRPHFWEKTTHGITQCDAQAMMRQIQQLSPQNPIITVDTARSER